MESLNTCHLSSTLLQSWLNPSFLRIRINLNKLKTLAPFKSSTCIHSGLVCLIDLYILVDEVVGLFHTQKVNLQSRNKVVIEDALTWSTRLMDSYSKIVDLLAPMKENARILYFALRRKGIDVYSTTNGHVLDYFLSRKKAKKNVVTCLGSLERLESEIVTYLVAGEDHHLSMVIEFFRQIVVATISLFRCVLLNFSGKLKVDKWFSLITKLTTMGKTSSYKSHGIVNDTDMIDFTINSLWKDIKKNECKTVEVQLVMERLHKLDCQIESYEVGLDSLCRKLIQTRVSLLNILAK